MSESESIIGKTTTDAKGRVWHTRPIGHITRLNVDKGNPTVSTPNLTSNDRRAAGFQAGVEFQQRQQASDVKALMHTLQTNVTSDRERSTPGAWPYFLRAQEHLITDIDPDAGATPHGTVVVGPTGTTPLARMWMSDAIRATQFANLIEWPDSSGLPGIPVMSTIPTAGNQGAIAGEKTELFSKAFDIQPDDGTLINSTLYLNISALIEDAGMMGLADALMSWAVANEANSQIVTAMTDLATDGGADIESALAAFDGSPFNPNVVIVPPSQVFAVQPVVLAAAGLDVVIDASATAVLVADRNASVGWFKRGTMRAAEPSTYGTEVAHVVYGKLGVQPGGVVAVTTA